jgi:hypothetical protein
MFSHSEFRVLRSAFSFSTFLTFLTLPVIPAVLPAAAGIGFELALFSPRPKPLIFSYYLVIKELTPNCLYLKLALFCQIILFSVF